MSSDYSPYNEEQQPGELLEEQQKQHDQQQDQVSMLVSTPHAHDVLCGRGGYCNSHEGNKNWRRLVASNKELYIAIPKFQKQLLSQSIVHAVKCQDPPGRFLMRDALTNLWYPIDDLKAIEKTSQALREGGVQIRETLEQERGVAPESLDLLQHPTTTSAADGVATMSAANGESTPSSINIYMPASVKKDSKFIAKSRVNDKHTKSKASSPTTTTTSRSKRAASPSNNATPILPMPGPPVLSGPPPPQGHGYPPTMMQPPTTPFPPHGPPPPHIAFPGGPTGHMPPPTQYPPGPPHHHSNMPPRGMEPYYGPPPMQQQQQQSSATQLTNDRSAKIFAAALAAHQRAGGEFHPASSSGGDEAVIIAIPDPPPRAPQIVTLADVEKQRQQEQAAAKDRVAIKKPPPPPTKETRPTSTTTAAATSKTNTTTTTSSTSKASVTSNDASSAEPSAITNESSCHTLAADNTTGTAKLPSLEPKMSISTMLQDLDDCMEKPSTSIGSLMSGCTPLPAGFQTSFGSMSISEDASMKKLFLNTMKIDKNAPTLTNHERSKGGLLDSDDDEDDDDNHEPSTADWDKMRAAFGMTDDMPHEIHGGTTGMDLTRDISGMSTLSMGDFSLERSPSSTIMRDITTGSQETNQSIPTTSAAEPKSTDSTSKGDDSNLSDQEKMEKMYLDRGASLVYEDFGRK